MPPSKHLNNVPLSLDTHWFTHSEPQFPYPALRAHSPITTSNYTWEYLESATLDHTRDYTFIGAVLWEVDGSITKIRVTWNSGDVDGTVKGEVKSTVSERSIGVSGSTSGSGPPGGELNASELRLAARWYGAPVLEWCQAQVGGRVGDGECWTLAFHALVAAGKVAIKAGHEPAMLSMGRVHGQSVFEWTTTTTKDQNSFAISPGTMQQIAEIYPGDILELTNAHFHKSKMVLGLMRQQENVRLNAHTAIIASVQGEKLGVIEQNARVKYRVVEGEYDLTQMMAGNVTIYRPVGRSVTPFPTLQGVCDTW